MSTSNQQTPIRIKPFHINQIYLNSSNNNQSSNKKEMKECQRHQDISIKLIEMELEKNKMMLEFDGSEIKSSNTFISKEMELQKVNNYTQTFPEQQKEEDLTFQLTFQQETDEIKFKRLTKEVQKSELFVKIKDSSKNEKDNHQKKLSASSYLVKKQVKGNQRYTTLRTSPREDGFASCPQKQIITSSNQTIDQNQLFALTPTQQQKRDLLRSQQIFTRSSLPQLLPHSQFNNSQTYKSNTHNQWNQKIRKELLTCFNENRQQFLTNEDLLQETYFVRHNCNRIKDLSFDRIGMFHQKQPKSQIRNLRLFEKQLKLNNHDLSSEYQIENSKDNKPEQIQLKTKKTFSFADKQEIPHNSETNKDALQEKQKQQLKFQTRKTEGNYHVSFEKNNKADYPYQAINMTMQGSDYLKDTNDSILKKEQYPQYLPESPSFYNSLKDQYNNFMHSESNKQITINSKQNETTSNSKLQTVPLQLNNQSLPSEFKEIVKNNEQLEELFLSGLKDDEINYFNSEEFQILRKQYLLQTILLNKKISQKDKKLIFDNLSYQYCFSTQLFSKQVCQTMTNFLVQNKFKQQIEESINHKYEDDTKKIVRLPVFSRSYKHVELPSTIKNSTLNSTIQENQIANWSGIENIKDEKKIINHESFNSTFQQQQDTKQQISPQQPHTCQIKLFKPKQLTQKYYSHLQLKKFYY